MEVDNTEEWEEQGEWVTTLMANGQWDEQDALNDVSGVTSVFYIQSN
jgi:hypothetical protein